MCDRHEIALLAHSNICAQQLWPPAQGDVTECNACVTGLSVRELTGDMQLSKRELADTQMIVTTPEKWDVVTRKGGDAAAAASVRLLIIDEVHLLNDERGPVIETLIARTQRQVKKDWPDLSFQDCFRAYAHHNYYSCGTQR